MPIILLDLNYTLVANSVDQRQLRGMPQYRRIAREIYRPELVDLCKPFHTILITARAVAYQVQTLARIKRLTGWQPQEWYFNADDTEPPVWKETAITTFVIPKHGSPEATCYLAIESNELTNKMYQRHGIPALKYWGGQHQVRAPAIQSTLF